MRTKDLTVGMTVAVKDGHGGALGARYGVSKAIILDTQTWHCFGFNGLGWLSTYKPGPGPTYGSATRGLPVAIENRARQVWEPDLRIPAQIFGTWEEHEAALTDAEASRAAQQIREAQRRSEATEWAATITARFAALGIDHLVLNYEFDSGVTLNWIELEQMLYLADIGAEAISHDEAVS